MKTIWKFPLRVVDRQTVSMPIGSVALSAQVQGGGLGELCLWALCDTGVERKDVTIWVFGTGHPLPHYVRMTYVGTTQMSGGALVWHVFVEE